MASLQGRGIVDSIGVGLRARLLLLSTTPPRKTHATPPATARALGGGASRLGSRQRAASQLMAQPSVESTSVLLARVRAGDAAARERLVARYLPLLRRWAHGRLPGYARGAIDTDDLVQNTMLRALDRVGEFEPRREGAFLAYLRRTLLNALRDEIRRSRRRPAGEQLGDELADALPSAVEQAIGKQLVERYEAALETLQENQREAVILSVEFGYSPPEIAAAIGSPSANAARMVVARALVRIAELLDEPG
jgi:RNA polymerase sigma-70 factor (ECF subfamily)